MADILLAHSYFLNYDLKQIAKMRPYPPLGTLYAASVLRNAGYSVALFDAMLSGGEHEFADALSAHRPRFVVLYEDVFNFLTKMCLSRMRDAALNMCEAAHRFGALVIASGPDVTDRPALYFARGVLYAVLGEGENTLRELIDCLAGRGGRSPREVPGLALHALGSPSGVVRTAPRPPERHPDAFPWPAWDLVDVDRYRAAWREAHGSFSMNLVSSRGCPFRCNWCAKPTWGQQYAVRSARNVAAEMSYVKRLFRPDHIWFADDIFGLRPRWLSEFSTEVRARDAGVPFTIQSRADLMTPEAVQALKRAGCIEVWIGAESGSQSVLDAMDKGISVAEIGAARANLGAQGIRAGFFIQLGYPGESLADIEATVAMLRDLLPDAIGVSVSYPLPGTRFYDMVRAGIGTKTNWVDSDDLAMLFHGSFTTEFYKSLHTVLHQDLEARLQLATHPRNNRAKARSVETDAQWRALRSRARESRSAQPTLVRPRPTASVCRTGAALLD